MLFSPPAAKQEWTYGICESCGKNSHEQVKMVKHRLEGIEFWICPQCGASKLL